jgi:hypothetical protein
MITIDVHMHVRCIERQVSGTLRGVNVLGFVFPHVPFYCLHAPPPPSTHH